MDINLSFPSLERVLEMGYHIENEPNASELHVYRRLKHYIFRLCV